MLFTTICISSNHLFTVPSFQKSTLQFRPARKYCTIMSGKIEKFICVYSNFSFILVCNYVYWHIVASYVFQLNITNHKIIILFFFFLGGGKEVNSSQHLKSLKILTWNKSYFSPSITVKIIIFSIGKIFIWSNRVCSLQLIKLQKLQNNINRKFGAWKS